VLPLASGQSGDARAHPRGVADPPP